jgi:pimeloyl-ACP methyl ester carboxylesterase
MERVEVDGVQLEYQISGSGTGDPVVFIHGAFIADSFRPLVAKPALAERYKLITYRRHGYGGTHASLDKTPTTAERQAADCAGLLRNLGVERVCGGTLVRRLLRPPARARCA